MHRRSGVPSNKIAELHGNNNKEFCPKCGEIYYRDYNTRNRFEVHAHETNRKCTKCNVPLKDTLINFNENLGEKELKLG